MLSVRAAGLREPPTLGVLTVVLTQQGQSRPACPVGCVGVLSHPASPQLTTGDDTDPIFVTESLHYWRVGVRGSSPLGSTLFPQVDRLAIMIDSQAIDRLTLPTWYFVALSADITWRYWAVHQTSRGVETVWNLRAGIKAHAMQRGLRTQLLQQETIESDHEGAFWSTTTGSSTPPRSRAAGRHAGRQQDDGRYRPACPSRCAGQASAGLHAG
jgi:hypothetical protein